MTTATATELYKRPESAVKRLPKRSRYVSFDDFLLSDFGEKHVEWTYGRVEEMSPVLVYHADLSQFLIIALGTFVGVNGLGKIFHEPYLMRCNATLPARCPDILFVKTENADKIGREYLDGAADLVIEIVSEESRTRDRGAKFNEYEAGGVGEYWILDPARSRAEFYLRDAGGVFRVQTPPKDATTGEETYACAAIPGVVITLSWLWRKPMPSVTVPLRAWGVLP